MNLYNQFKTDPQLEKEGVWVQYGTTEDDKPIRFRVTRAGQNNVRYMKLMEQRLKPFRRQIQTETMDQKLARKLNLEIFVDAVLVDWENVRDESDQDLPFSRENAIKLFTDLPDIYEDLQEQATKAALFRQQTVEVDSGN